MAKLKGSTVLIVLGVALIALGAAYPFVTLVVDTTAPTLSNFVPASGSVIPSINSASVTAADSTSGVQQVLFSLGNADTGQYIIYQKSATLTSGTKNSGTWSVTITEVSTPGNYYIYWQACDYAGNWKTATVTFKIYTQLQGKWYINDQEITSTSQTVYSRSASVSFKFQKTAGIDDSYISCWVEEGGTKILTLTLTNTTSHIWTGSYTFSSGTHNIAIKAYDGTTTITYSIVGLTIPGAVEWVMTTQQTLILAGVLSIAAGAVLRVKKR
jgi:hypothetical protein